MRVIGIDPGIVTTGYGVVDEENHRLIYVASGSISTAAKQPLPKRLKKIYDELLAVFQAMKPAAVAVENTFVTKNFQSGLKLGQARGIALLAAEQYGVPVFDTTPTEVKQAVVGYGAARKDQVGVMVGRLLDLKSPPDSDHASDALAVAICYLHSARIWELTSRSAVSGGLPARRAHPL
ncbi:MAG: crossover junction endodeoxyribonuclease RuvC [Nitrospirae bacterium]|nr:crossover junction endodeoxyribonuclease RuvC [Nitrospirota bacterium]